MAIERSKKTEVITFRTTHENKKKLQEEAEKREWTIAQLVEKIVSLYINEEKRTTLPSVNVAIEKNHTININGG